MIATLRRLYLPALVAFLLGMVSLGSLGAMLLAITGIPALILGLRSLRRINSSDGELSGAWLAIAGMILGGVGTIITVIGIVAILIVKVQVTSRQIEGMNHLRLIGEALNGYHVGNGAFPRATRDPSGLDPDRRISWMADLLPFMVPPGSTKPIHRRLEQLSEQLDRDKAWDDPANARVANSSIRLFLAPAHPDYDPQRVPGETHFVGISGVGSRAAYLPRSNPRAGVFGHTGAVSRDQITRGLTYTFMVLETAHENGPWLAGDFPTARGIPAEGDEISGPGRPFGGICQAAVQALFADGSVRSLRDDTPGDVFRAHATIREGK